ncbi:MAG TPA: hypothetical protein DEP35_12835 [Deltaproteobacteria bacterium]|nr:hypothetical protein [Deltaproteobacteria bacterium]
MDRPRREPPARWLCDLSRSRRRPRLQRGLFEREALRAQTACGAIPGSRSPSRDRDRSGRGGPGRLRRGRPHGAPPREREVPPHGALRDDARLQPKGRGLLTWRSSSEVWARPHEQAFRRLGGSVHTVVLDNLREGVLTPDVYDPTLNPLYRNLLAHYGVVALPCRPQHPDRKGKVERSVDHTERALRRLRFGHPDAAQAYLDRWEERWADTRHPRHHQAPGGGDVCRGEAPPKASSLGALPLLPLWPTHRPPRRRRRGGG